jgi:4'-phosphopantetheinyl transferase
MSSFTPKTVKQIPSLKNGDVHVWKLDLSGNFECWNNQTLSKDELEKVMRLRSAAHQAQAKAMRIQLRQLLSIYLAVKPSDIVFKQGKFGKPYVENSVLSFNVSHSKQLGLVAISLNKDLGVDIEYWRHLDNLEGMVRRNFSDVEKQQWEHIPDKLQEATFFDIWTCKEAFIKATGRGLGMGVSRCGFELKHPYQLNQCPAEYGSVSQWICIPLDIGEKVSASLLTRAESCKPLIYTFDSENPPRMA